MLIACPIISHLSDASSFTRVSDRHITSRASTAFEVVPGDGISGLFSIAAAVGYLDIALGPHVYFPGQC